MPATLLLHFATWWQGPVEGVGDDCVMTEPLQGLFARLVQILLEQLDQAVNTVAEPCSFACAKHDCNDNDALCLCTGIG